MTEYIDIEKRAAEKRFQRLKDFYGGKDVQKYERLHIALSEPAIDLISKIVADNRGRQDLLLSRVESSTTIAQTRKTFFEWVYEGLKKL